MRSHDSEIEQIDQARDATTRPDEHADLAARALADRRPGALDRPSLVHLQASAGNSSVSRFLGDEGGPEKVRTVLGSGGGERMDDLTMHSMEERFGEDFSDVRLHRDGRAAESARAVNAHAYTVGNDIVFQAGRYDPDSSSGRRTLAHELTHVVQQRTGPVEGTGVGGGIRVSHPSDRFEQAATSNAERLLASPAPEPAAPTRPATAQRELETDASSVVMAQRQAAPEEEEEEAAGLMAQRQAAPEEEEEEAAGLMAQRQAAPEEEEEEAAPAV